MYCVGVDNRPHNPILEFIMRLKLDGKFSKLVAAGVLALLFTLPLTLPKIATSGINDRFQSNEFDDGVTPGIYQALKSFVFDSNNAMVLNRNDASYGYGMNFDADACFNVAGAAKKSYAVQISGDRAAAYAVTGDSNDAIIKINGNNYAANDANFILRGINASINNRSGGTLGRLEHSFGTQNKSGGTSPTILGGTFVAENYGTCATEFGGIDVLLKNEGTVATKEYGIRLRNGNNSVADAVGTAIEVSDTGANTGWDRLIDASGATIGTSLMNIAEDGTVAEKDNSQAIGSFTTAGFLKIEIAGNVRYIWLASTAPTS
jgi:hypothetical protein